MPTRSKKPRNLGRGAHYRLEHIGTDLGVSQTIAGGYRLVAPEKADTFPTSAEALVAAAGQPVEVVRVEA